MKTEKYEHHGVEVVTNSETKGKHRDLCLCYACVRMLEGCPIANDTYENCKKHNLVTPVLECPKFSEEV